MNIPIVVAAYSRTLSLERLLISLVMAKYERPVKLIISIDGGGTPDVRNYADHFDWPHGKKEVIAHQENKGLREHILFCGGLARKYDGVVVLEDDLYVSPCFYQYAVEAAVFCQGSKDVAGIALYSPSFNESARLPFYPLADGYDVFYMQVACSWGQLWLRQQWEDFEGWYSVHSNLELSEDKDLPYEIRNWPDSSWKKYFIKYLTVSKTYFMYPRSSFSTNFGDIGQHHTGTSLHQVPLQFGKEKKINFVNFNESVIKYDAFCEMLPESLTHLCHHLEDLEFDVDLYGIKERHCFTHKYVLTSKSCEKFVKSFGRHLMPIEYNVIDSIPGNDLFLALVDDVCQIDESDFRIYIYTKCATIEEQKYFYNISNLHYFIFNKKIKELNRICESGYEKIGRLKDNVDTMKNKLNEMENSLAQSQRSVELVKNSFSYRIGNKLLYPFSLLKGIARD